MIGQTQVLLIAKQGQAAGMPVPKLRRIFGERKRRCVLERFNVSEKPASIGPQTTLTASWRKNTFHEKRVPGGWQGLLMAPGLLRCDQTLRPAASLGIINFDLYRGDLQE